MTKPGQIQRLPEPLPLRKHVEKSTKDELRGFLEFWDPAHAKKAAKRHVLAERMYAAMSDENLVYAKVDQLSERVRAVLMALLRKMHYTSDLSGLFRGLDGLEIEHYEAEAALTALVKRGFVRRTRAPEWLHYGRHAYAIPHETALVLRGLAGTDQRPLEQVFLHERFKPTSIEAASADELPPLPESVRDAIAALPEENLRRIAIDVIEEHGGICTRQEFAQAFLAERGIPWRSAAFLRAFGGGALGTVGHIDLRARGIGVDDDALLFFSEAVERYVDEWRSETLVYDTVLTAHGDLMSDVLEALDVVREGAVKIAKDGSVYKASRNRIAERLRFPEQPLLDRVEAADRVLALVRGLGLADRDGGNRLAVTEAGDGWRDRALLDKIDDALTWIRKERTQTLRARHLRAVHRHLVDLLTDPRANGAWWPGKSAGMLARNRYLLELERDETTINGAQLALRAGALSELGGAAQEIATRDLFALGLVDVAMKDGQAAGVRLSRLGRRVLLDRSGETDGRPLLVNPDFEMMVLPEGDVDELLHGLDRVAERTRSGEVVHYRLDRARIERLAVAGATADELLEFLGAHARTALPQNVVYSVRSWSGDVRTASLRRGVLFVASDASVIDAVLSHPGLKDLVAEIASPTSVFFDDSVDEARIAQELKALGVYLK